MKMWWRAGVVALFSVCACQAVDWKARYPKPEGYVSDFAHVIDARSRQQLEAYGAIVEKSTGAQMAFVTIPSLEGEPVEDVANTIFRAWGVGQKATNEGLMLLLSIQDRRSRLEVGYGLEPVLPDGLAGDILRQMRPALRQGDYGDAMMAAGQTMGDAIAKAKNVQLLAHLPKRRASPSANDQFPFPVIIGVFILIGILSRFAGPRGYGGFGGGGGMLPWLILGNMMGRSSWGGRGSGGFGGSDSGDSFGGFGGGDSGGGGASSDW